MIEQTVDLPRLGKSMEIFVAHPDQGGPFPPVVMYMDMWGMREVLRDLARRVATVGYCCVLPDFYYRGGRVRYAEQDDARLGKSFADIAPGRQSALQSAMDGLSDAMVVEDSVVHKQAQHAYAIPDRDVFDKHAANRDWEHIFAMLRRQVPCQASIAAAVSTQT